MPGRDFECGQQAPPEYFEQPGPSDYDQALSHIALYVSSDTAAQDLLASIADGDCEFISFNGDWEPRK